MEKKALIPSLNVGNNHVTDRKENAKLFKEFFDSKCSPITNDS